jgi:hypothetical protein
MPVPAKKESAAVVGLMRLGVGSLASALCLFALGTLAPAVFALIGGRGLPEPLLERVRATDALLQTSPFKMTILISPIVSMLTLFIVWKRSRRDDMRSLFCCGTCLTLVSMASAALCVLLMIFVRAMRTS